MNPINLFFLMFIAFIATEGTVEYLLGVPFDKVEKWKPYKWLLMYFSAGLGIFLAIYYQLDMIFLLAVALGIPDVMLGLVGMIVTGIILGRGANFVNDVWQRFFPSGTQG